MDSNKIHISRNVVFHETIFPFSTDQPIHLDGFFSMGKMPHSEASDVPPLSGESPAAESEIPAVVGETCEPVNVHPTREASKRTSKPPGYLNEYLCHMTETDIPYPLAAYISYAKLSEGYESYICALAQHVEPASFAQAKKFDVWLKAMNEELLALESTNTWTICSLPDGKHKIGCKWVYRVKLKADGTLERCKARLVAKGYTQQEGIDFIDTFSPVAKMTTVKTLLAVSAAKNWSLTQLDISNAFLNGDLQEEIYMSLPPGYTPKEGESQPPNAVCRLNKSLYGLEQASRQWFIKFSTTILSLGFQKSHTDHTLFIKNVGGKYVAVLVYVDDIIIASSNDLEVEILKSNLQHSFKLRDLGPLKFFLGLEIARSSQGIAICQQKYGSTSWRFLRKLVCWPVNLSMFQWILM